MLPPLAPVPPVLAEPVLVEPVPALDPAAAPLPEFEEGDPPHETNAGAASETMTARVSALAIREAPMRLSLVRFSMCNVHAFKSQGDHPEKRSFECATLSHARSACQLITGAWGGRAVLVAASGQDQIGPVLASGSGTIDVFQIRGVRTRST